MSKKNPTEATTPDWMKLDDQASAMTLAIDALQGLSWALQQYYDTGESIDAKEAYMYHLSAEEVVKRLREAQSHVQSVAANQRIWVEEVTR